jgi:hypothetical protein
VILGKTGVAVHVDSAPVGAFWNAIARAWFVTVDGETVRLNPQPPAPVSHVHGLVPSPRIDL